MLGLNSALRRILHSNTNGCCLCFKQIDDEDNWCTIQDEVTLEYGYSVEIFKVLSQVLGNQTFNDLATDSICHQCTDLAIKSYTFINMCKHNIKLLNKTVTTLQNYDKETIQEHNGSNSLFLVTNDEKLDEYYDKRINKKRQPVLLKRLQVLIKKSKDNSNNLTVDFEFDDNNAECKQSINKIEKRLKSVKIADIILHDSDNLNDLKCKTCLKVYPTKWNLKQHYLRVHAPKDFNCTICSRSFGTSLLLKRHKKLSHCTMMCSQCGKTYTNTYSLRHHERSHKSQLICHTCGKVYKGKQSLNKHIELQLCQKMRKSNSEATFACGHCPKKYSAKTALNVHIRLEHENGRALLCQWCSKKFSSMSRLKEHIITHTKQKKFSCDICNGQFVTKASLLYHTRIHTGERPYQCNQCDMRFLSASRRSEHVRSRHMPPNVECEVCHSVFKGQAGLLRHKKKRCDIIRLFECVESGS